MRRILLSLFILCLICTPAHSNDPTQKRVILALFDSTEELNPREDDNLVHHSAEVILNYLGMKVRYHDIQKGLPAKDDMENVYGVITWFTNHVMPNAVEYCQWAIEQMNNGKKYVVLGVLGAYEDQNGKKTPVPVISEVFAHLGLGYGGEWTDDPFRVELVRKDSRMVEFERTLKDEVGNYEKFLSLRPHNKVYLTLQRSDIQESESAVVVTTPRGGFALLGYELFIEYESKKFQWRINPFRFFEEAFALKGKPRYDTTTLFGRRILYSHIDGDGFQNVSQIDSTRSSGEMIFEEILQKYTIPTTVSFIQFEVDPKYLGTKKFLNLAKTICMLDHIEIGVHGFTHPYDWQKKTTAFELAGYSISPRDKKSIAQISASEPGAKVIIVDQDRYLKTEIEDVVHFHNTYLAPPHKKVVIQQWTGECNPLPEAIDMANRLGIGNINGGDTRFDQLNPSYTEVAPLIRQTHGRIQMYTSNANENIYTNGWSGPFYGFRHLIETFRQTEHPTLVDEIYRRVTPINIYYHFYSGEKPSSLRALKEVYDYALTQEIIPIFTSEYVSIVEGFLNGKIEILGEDHWQFKNYGQGRTVRFDRLKKFPDLKRSKGILGFARWHDSLYIHLDESDEAILHLISRPPQEAYVKSASSILSKTQISKKTITFTTQGFGERIYEFANMLPRARYEVIVRSDKNDPIAFKQMFRSDEQGNLSIEILITGNAKVNINQKG